MKDSQYAIVKLQEIIDDMSQAIVSLAKSLNKTKSMVDVITQSKRASEFKEDCDEMMKAHDAKQKEYEALLKHRNLLKELIAKHEAASAEEKEIIESTILTIFIGFNVIQDSELEG